VTCIVNKDMSHQSTRILLVIPAYNEEVNIGMVLESIEHDEDLDVIVVDDNSMDNTVKVALQHGAGVLPLSIRLGAWGATQTGIRYGLLNGYDIFVTMDADGQHHPGDLPLLIQELVEEEVDVIIGSCPGRGSFARKTAWWIFRKLSGVKLEDLTSGLKAYNKQAACHLVKADATIFDYQDLGVILYLLKNKMKIREKDVAMCPRRDGKSRVFNSWLLVVKYMIQTIILCLSMRVSKNTPASEKS